MRAHQPPLPLFLASPPSPDGRRRADPLVSIGGYYQGRRLASFGWYGGKLHHLNWLLPLLPPAHHYCEPFGGSVAVLLNRPPSPIETYNDIDGEVVNFFRVLREQPEELIWALVLTPYSREEFAIAISPPEEPLTDLERARRFFVHAAQTHAQRNQTPTLGRWRHSIQYATKGMAAVVACWSLYVDKLAAVAERLLRVQIENRPALEVIRLYDSPDTLFYCDPPYPRQARRAYNVYAFEMDDDAHRALAEALHSCKGKVAISGYRCPLMDELYGDWQRYDAPVKPCRISGTPRQESLWVNYRLDT